MKWTQQEIDYLKEHYPKEGTVGCTKFLKRRPSTIIELKFNSRKRLYDGTASLDRIDSSKGYTLGNIQWVHKWVNLMKQDMTDQEFIEWCKTITNFNTSKKSELPNFLDMNIHEQSKFFPSPQ
jgi:hypothetical protein